MTFRAKYYLKSGDCPVRTSVEHWSDGRRHELRCLGNTLRLDRPPVVLDLLTIADPRYSPDSENFFKCHGGGGESRPAESPCTHGDLAKGGLMASAHSLVQPNNASRSSARPAVTPV